MPALLLPASKDPSKVFLKTFDHSANGLPPEEFVVPLSDISTSIGAALAVNNTYQGEVITRFNAGTAIPQWQAVYLTAGSVWALADSDGSGTFPARGVATAVGANGVPLTVLTNGEARNDTWNWTIGGNVYLTSTPGVLSQTPSATHIR